MSLLPVIFEKTLEDMKTSQEEIEIRKGLNHPDSANTLKGKNGISG